MLATLPEYFPYLIGVICVAFTVEALAGFGSIILSLAIGVHFAPLRELIAILVPLNLLLCSTIAFRNRQHVRFPLVFQLILPVMGVGLILGQLAFYKLDNHSLRVMLGIVLIATAIRELSTLMRKLPPKKYPPLLLGLWIFGAGMIHGAFATGGPFLVTAISRMNLTKNAFRATLAMIWIIFDLVLITSFIFSQTIGNSEATASLSLLPFLFLALFVGDYLHHRIDEGRFRVFIYCLILVAGLSIIL